MKAVAYYRVSTAAQGRSGLGLAAQEDAVERLAAARQFELLASYTEVESGKRKDRPELMKALRHARLTDSTLVIAKLDRLSRNAAFLLTLRDSGARFIAADLPDANDLTSGILALVAQAEADAISQRTKEALWSVKRRIESEEGHISARSGRRVHRLGNPNGSKALHAAGQGNKEAVAAVKAQAQGRAGELAEIITDLQQIGCRSLPALAAALNEKQIVTPRGGRWHSSSVRNLVQRLALASEP